MKTRVRLPGSARREQIADAALRLLSEKGITALTSAAIGAEVGLTSGALFRHFASMDAILETAVERAALRLEACFPPQDGAPRERLAALVRNRVELFRQDAGLAWLMRSDEAHAMLPAAAVARLGGLVDRSRDYLLTALRDGTRDGSVRTDIEPAALLVIVVGTVHALVGQPGVHRRAARPRDDLVERVLAALGVMLAPPSADPSSRGPIPA